MSNLSVLHISTADNLGGSGRSAYKVHCGLKELGVDSKMLVKIKITSDKDVDFISRRWVKLADRIVSFTTDFLGLQYLHFPSSGKLLRHPWFEKADVIQLYNTHGGYFSHSSLPQISKRKKIVWRLSDMWPVTGHCAYAGSCEKWRNGCKECPDLASYPSLSWDSASLLWRWKRYIYRRSKIHIVAPSSWTKEIADQSPLFEGFAKSIIPNGINTNTFKPIPQKWCRAILNIPEDKKVILFLAHVLDDNPRKGSEFFIKAINLLWNSKRNDLMVMLVGKGASNWGSELPYPVWRHDFVAEDELLAIIYNAADVYVHPAVLENMPNSILEAMGCGVPSVAFDSGGVKDVVRHKQTGYLAGFKDAQDLAEGIIWLMESQERRAEISNNCRDLILEDFTVEKQAQAFLNLYKRLIEEK